MRRTKRTVPGLVACRSVHIFQKAVLLEFDGCWSRSDHGLWSVNDHGCWSAVYLRTGSCWVGQGNDTVFLKMRVGLGGGIWDVLESAIYTMMQLCAQLRVAAAPRILGGRGSESRPHEAFSSGQIQRYRANVRT